jgi:hypothetical protein
MMKEGKDWEAEMLKVKLRVQEGPHLARNIVCVHLADLIFAETLNSEQGCILGNWTITIRSIGRGKYLHFWFVI